MTMFIGLGHYSRTGKDTFANEFVKHLQETTSLTAKKVSFATKLKQVAHELYGWAGLRDEDFYNTQEGEKLRDQPLSGLGGLTPIDIWVRLGTNAVREQVWDNTWVDYVLHGVHKEDFIIIPDVRFENEVKAIREKSGLVFKIVRPGIEPRNTVPDQALVDYKDWDAIFGATGKIEDLRAEARALASLLRHMKGMPRCACGPKASTDAGEPTVCRKKSHDTSIIKRETILGHTVDYLTETRGYIDGKLLSGTAFTSLVERWKRGYENVDDEVSALYNGSHT